MDTLIQDLRFAFRTLIKSPAFALIAVLTLTIGIGANTAIFSLVQAALLRPLPYKDVERIVSVFETNPRDGFRFRQASYPDYLDWKRASVFEGTAAYGTTAMFLGSDSPERINAGRITADFFKVLGVPLALGRHFTESEENGEGHAAIASYGFWQQRLGGDQSALGQTVILNTIPYTIIGVVPASFHFAPAGPADLWVPLNPSTVLRERRFSHWLSVIGRIRDSVTVESAQPELTAIGSRIAQLDQQFHAESSISLNAFSERIVGPVRPVLVGLFVAVGLVLLIACANVANLVLTRSTGRQREIAIRMAVGANRRRLVRQLLTETILLSSIGGSVGVLCAPQLIRFLIAGIPENQLNTMPFLVGAGVNVSVLAFTAAAVLLTGTICGLLPALQMSSNNLRTAIARTRTAIRNGFVIAEIALALVLLVAAGLLMKSMLRLLEVDPGFNTRNLNTMRLSLLTDNYQQPAQRQAYFERVIEDIDALPGVLGATAVDILPLSGGGNTGIPTLEGKSAPIDFSANVRTVLPNYFEVMGIPLIQGRSVSARDTANSPMVVAVNQAFASRAFGGQDPLGKRMSFAFIPNTLFEIVGVVGNENVTGLDAAINPVIYFAYHQSSPSTMSLVVRTASDPANLSGAMRAAISNVDSKVPVYAMRTMDNIIELSPYAFARQYPAILIGLLAAVALLLASIGIYGVISYSVTQRTRELGIRMALGARRSDVFRLILREGSVLGTLGIAIGLGLALLVTRFISNLLFGVTATDPIVFGSVAATFMAVTLLACYLPARRATRIDPQVALRDQ